MKLNLGCSDDLMAGYTNVDIGPDPRRKEGRFVPPDVDYFQADLAEPWRWDTDSIDEVRAADVFEHIGDCQHIGMQVCQACYKPRRGLCSGCALCGTMPCLCRLRAQHGKIHVMNEAWRVLKPGGRLHFTVPSFRLKTGHVNDGAVSDPTHATMWSWDDQFYFSHQFNFACVAGTYLGRPEAGERFRLGPAYGIKAVFRYPPIEQRHDGSWKPANLNSDLRWYVRDDAGGTRSKLVGILEAVK